MRSLTSHINSRYMTAANALQSQNSRRRIIAYVESYDDVLFWRTVLNQFETSKRYFEIMLPTQSDGNRRSLARGKKSALKNIIRGAGKDMIACVDADYDYLMQGMTPNSADMLSMPYVFHTFAYAIENLQCYAQGLHNVCVMVTLNDHRVFDFEAFMQAYSEAIYPLFVWSVWFYRTGRYDIMTISDMDCIISIGRFSMENADNIISRVRGKVKQKVNQLRSSYPDIPKQLPPLRDELTRLGITPQNTYLYIHGHHLFEKIVLPMMSYVCEYLRREKEAEIRHQSIHRTQMNNELSCYNNSLEDISSMLKKGTGYMMSDVFRNITEKLHSAFDG